MIAVAPGPAEIRVARPEDVAEVGALTAEAYLADGLIDAEHDYTAELRDADRRSREATLLVAAVPVGEREAVVGTITLAPYGSGYAEVAEPGEWELRMLAVAPEARRQGIAEHLVLGALREAVAGGARRVALSTVDSMHAAHRLYARLGFMAAPERDWGHEEVRLAVHTWTPPDAPGALVEAATWPPVRTVDVDGWRAGLSGGLSRRANSVLPLTAPPDPAAAVDAVEALYRAEGLRPAFRVDPDCRPPGLAGDLAARGYREVAVTDVLVRALPMDPVPDRPTRLHVGVSDRPDDEWLAALAGRKGGDPAVARAILTGAPAHYLTAVMDGRHVGMARVAYAQGWAGLSGVVVSPYARRTGVARALSRRAMELAAAHGARRAFLQVETANVAAWRLYTALGFRPAARYRYLEAGGEAD